MHPYHLEVMAAERRRALMAEADQRRLTQHALTQHAQTQRARYVSPHTHSRARVLIAVDAFSAYARRCRRRLRAAFATDRLLWREEAARNS
jgi:hypothetical protein